MQEIEVKVENDHIERLTTAKPILALSEVIWNAYDADARSVRVEFEEGALTNLALIRIQDDGDGIPLEEAEGFFKSLGGSWKRRDSWIWWTLCHTVLPKSTCYSLVEAILPVLWQREQQS